MMTIGKIEVSLPCSQSKAFRTLCNVNNIPKWSSQTKHIEGISDGPISKGYKFKAGDKNKSFEYKVIKYQPPTMFQFEEEDGVGFLATLKFSKQRKGTKLEFTQEVKKSLFMIIFSPIIKRMIRKTNQVDAELIKMLISGNL